MLSWGSKGDIGKKKIKNQETMLQHLIENLRLIIFKGFLQKSRKNPSGSYVKLR